MKKHVQDALDLEYARSYVTKFASAESAQEEPAQRAELVRTYARVLSLPSGRKRPTAAERATISAAASAAVDQAITDLMTYDGITDDEARELSAIYDPFPRLIDDYAYSDVFRDAFVRSMRVASGSY